MRDDGVIPTAERADRERVMRGQTAFDGKCSAHRHSDGKPCQRPAARGATVCPVHGGSAPQVKAAAKRRLDQAADALVQKLLKFALDDDAPDNIALAAIRDALDRAGLVAPRTLDVALGPAPWMEVFDGIASGSRSQSRAARGVPDEDSAETPEWVTAELEAAQHTTAAPEVIDAEVEPDPDPAPRRRYRPPPITGLDAIAEAARARPGGPRAAPAAGVTRRTSAVSRKAKRHKATLLGLSSR